MLHPKTYLVRRVLKPEGMVEIKFRMQELLQCMQRIDPQLLALK
jgi:acetyl-CoA carboxylase/biotin carboxylase 1